MKKFFNKCLHYLSVRKIKIQNYILCHREIYLSKRFIKNDKRKTFVACYDLLAHGVSVGDMVFFCFYLKYFQLKGKFIDFKIIYHKSERNIFFKHLPESFVKKYYLSMKQDVIEKILGKKNCKISIVRWANIDFKRIKNDNQFIMFKKPTLKREHFYGNLHYMGNYFYSRENDKFLNKFKISKKIFVNNASPASKRFTNKKYITMHVRYDPIRATWRNISDTDLISFVNTIYQKKGKINILILSDKAGCDASKKIFNSHKSFFNKKCKMYFCKDFSKNILEDTYLMMNSRCVFSNPRVGGMTVWLWYTNIPFLLTFFTSNLLWFKLNVSKLFRSNASRSKAITFWNEKTQIWINSPSNEDFINMLEKYQFKY